MRIISSIVALAWVSLTCAQVPTSVLATPAPSITIPAQVIPLPTPAVTCVSLTTNPVQTLCGVGLSVTTALPPPVVVPPVGATKWMYLNGVKTLAGDFTASGETVNYENDTTTGLNGDTRDILITAAPTAGWLAYLPYWAANYALPNPGYKALIFSIKPSITGDAFAIHAERVGDSPLPSIEVQQAKYGPVAMMAGVWASYVIPLADLGVGGDATLYKVFIQSHTAAGGNSFEMDAIGFQ